MWIKSSRCAADKPQCVEVEFFEGDVYVRDSKSGETLWFTAEEWRAFIAGVRNDEFDCPADAPVAAAAV